MVYTTLVVASLALVLVFGPVGSTLAPRTVLATASSAPASVRGAVLFADDFSHGLTQWDVFGGESAHIRESGDPARGAVLELIPNGDVLALMNGSGAWRGVRVEGRMLFPSAIENYLGLVYNAAHRAGRWDFGLVYIKGNNGYLQLNPHRDFNVSRTLYPEFRVPLTGDAAVETGQWQTFAFEVVGTAMHVYIGPSNAPQMTNVGYERANGLFGLQPRSVGGPVWVDDVTVRAIDRLSHDSAGPSPVARPDGLLTSWRRAGPFERTDDRIAQRPSAYGSWSAVATDSRGAVVTGRDVDDHGPRTVAYYRATIPSPSARQAELAFGTVDDLAIWINGHFEGFVPRQDNAWFDVHVNPAHPGRRVPITLREGMNDVVVRVRGGVYASGGFFSRVIDAEGSQR